MSNVLKEKTGYEDSNAVIQGAKFLLEESLVDLTPEEKEIWIWNALVGISKIKQKRKS